jgi:hypothetical protein
MGYAVAVEFLINFTLLHQVWSIDPPSILEEDNITWTMYDKAACSTTSQRGSWESGRVSNIIRAVGELEFEQGPVIAFFQTQNSPGIVALRVVQIQPRNSIVDTTLFGSKALIPPEELWKVTHQ